MVEAVIGVVEAVIGVVAAVAAVVVDFLEVEVTAVAVVRVVSGDPIGDSS